MNKLILFICSLLLTGQGAKSQDSIRTRLEISTSAGPMVATDLVVSGWQVRQQLTYFPGRRLGVALGFGWGGFRHVGGVSSRSPAELNSVFARDLNTTDLSLVYRLVDVRRHNLTILAGVAQLQQTTARVDCVFTSPATGPEPVVKPGLSQTASVVPHVGATYQFRVSPRFGLGATGRLMLTGNGQSISQFGLLASYRFNVSAGSLGLHIDVPEQPNWGLRGAWHLVSNNETSNDIEYRNRFAAGLWAELPLGLSWAVRGELSYSQKGYNIGSSLPGFIPGQSRYAQITANFIDATMLFRYELTERCYLFLGPQIAFSVNGRVESYQPTYRLTPLTGGINSGIVLGASVSLSKRIALDARYSRDMIRFSSLPYLGYQGFQFGTSVRLSK